MPSVYKGTTCRQVTAGVACFEPYLLVMSASLMYMSGRPTIGANGYGDEEEICVVTSYSTLLLYQ